MSNGLSLGLGLWGTAVWAAITQQPQVASCYSLVSWSSAGKRQLLRIVF